MSCYHPIYALILQRKTIEGKMNLKILPRRGSFRQYQEQYGKDNVLSLPCGKCLGCQRDRVANWSTRLVLEGKYHDEKCFLTLTYDEAHCPERLSKKDLQNFMKRLRKAIDPVKVRYFACGEYGDHTKRPHYHVILFGFDFSSDRELVSYGSNKDPLYRSSLLESLWTFGLSSIGQVSQQSCAYVAGYCNKKLSGDSPFGDEFVLMSTRPGLGYQYLLDHPGMYDFNIIVDKDLGRSKRARIPRFFDKKCSRVEEVKPDRIRMSQIISVHKLASRGFREHECVWEYEEELKRYVPKYRLKGV